MVSILFRSCCFPPRQIVIESVRNFHIHVLSGNQLSFGGETDAIVDLRRVKPGSAQIGIAFFSFVYDHFEDTAHFRQIIFQGNLPLNFHQRIPTMYFRLFVDLMLHLRSQSIFLLRISENTHAIEFYGFHKICKFLKIFFGFPWKSRDKRRPDMNVWNFRSEPLNRFANRLRSRMTVHIGKNAVADVLQRNVQVIADLFFASDRLDQFLCNFVFIAVQKAYPADSFDAAEFSEQLRQNQISVQIDAVSRHILSDENQFRTAFGREELNALESKE